MEIPIKVSKSMDEMGTVDRRIARASRKFRERYDIGIGDVINLKSTDTTPISLKIEPGIENDTNEDEYSVFVTSAIFNLLHVANVEDNTIEVVDNITLGCDPELFLVDADIGTVINAGRFFSKNGQVGHDGLLLELRPDPSISEQEVVDNIRNLLLQARSKIIDAWGFANGNKVNLLAASHYDGLTAGFHLHFGLPNQLLGGNIDAGPFAHRLIRILDYYVGIPSVIPERDDSVRRCAPYISYGKPGQHRLDYRTLEYRVPGGYLLRSPVLATGLLGLGALVIEDVVSRIKKITNNFTNLAIMSSEEDLKGVYPTLPLIEEIFKSICNDDITEALGYINTIYKDVQKMVGYGRRKTSIDPFFTAILNDVQFDSNIASSWGI